MSKPPGCRQSLGELLEQLRPMVRAICAERLGCHQCDDLQQEAFLRVLRTCDQVRDHRALPGYLGTITRNLCSDQLRAQRSQPRFLHADSEWLENLADRSSHGPEDRSRVEELRVRVEALPIGLRRVLELFYFSKLDYQGIAQQTGLTVGSVGQRLSRARRQLRLGAVG